jgi:hypothetical protein
LNANSLIRNFKTKDTFPTVQVAQYQALKLFSQITVVSFNPVLPESFALQTFEV